MTFNIVVFGDSIQWGQGLQPGPAAPGGSPTGPPSDKMAERVATAFPNSQVLRLSHSGATINASLSSPSQTTTTSVTSQTLFPAGEVPGGTPTILDQVNGALQGGALGGGIDPNSIHLIILDGGINDVGLGVILNPFVDSPTVAATTSAACGGVLSPEAAVVAGGALTGQMTNLLSAVGSAFPNALVIVTGYYEALSNSSDVTGLVLTVGFIAGAVEPLLLDVPSAFDPNGWLISVLAGVASVSSAVSAVITNCATFRLTSDCALSSAVGQANEQFGQERFFFVPSPLKPLNAVFTGGSNGADETTSTAPALLWGFNPSLDTIAATIEGFTIGGTIVGSIIGGILLGPLGGLLGGNLGGVGGAAAAIPVVEDMLSGVDEVAASRSAICTSGIGCTLASVGHPNIEGEAAYANAISNLLADIGLAKAANASQGCMIVTAALGSPHAEEVTALRQARDEFLNRSALGRAFYSGMSKDYYAFSPIIASRMIASKAFKMRVRSLAVSPFLGFVELLSSWISDRGADGFQRVLALTLDASLEDLASSGIAAEHAAAASAEVSRLSVRRAKGSGTTSRPDLWGTEARQVVNYFNDVAGGSVQGDGSHLNVALLEPIKFYWRLLVERAAGRPIPSIQEKFEEEVTAWLSRASALASAATPGGEGVAADLKTLSEVLSKYGARHAFHASLFSEGDAP